ncbi:MAG TPA: pyridoxal 5'-phosphate synthase glutaminase subunit PdxT [Abditibacterium sp.]
MHFDDSPPTIGILALQGDYAAHQRILSALGARPKLVRAAADLDDLQGLIIPGGESTVMSRLCDRYDLSAPLKAKIEAGMPTLGTCAGLIFLAKTIEGGSPNFAQTTLGILDVSVQRNAYGAQTDSFETDVWVPELEESIRAVFIRAPRIESVGEGVEVLAQHEGAPVVVRQGSIVALAFHPEIAGESRVHRLWLADLLDAGSAP